MRRSYRKIALVPISEGYELAEHLFPLMTAVMGKNLMTDILTLQVDMMAVGYYIVDEHEPFSEVKRNIDEYLS